MGLFFYIKNRFSDIKKYKIKSKMAPNIPMYLRPSLLMRVGLSGCRTIGRSDYRAVGLSGCRTIGPSEYRAVTAAWFIFDNSDIHKRRYYEGAVTCHF